MENRRGGFATTRQTDPFLPDAGRTPTRPGMGSKRTHYPGKRRQIVATCCTVSLPTVFMTADILLATNILHSPRICSVSLSSWQQYLRPLLAQLSELTVQQTEPLNQSFGAMKFKAPWPTGHGAGQRREKVKSFSLPSMREQKSCQKSKGTHSLSTDMSRPASLGTSGLNQWPLPAHNPLPEEVFFVRNRTDKKG